MTTSTPDQSRPRLSVAMIVRDEEDVLPESLESIRSIADEIVVLDTGSIDQTPTVAEQHGALLSRAVFEDSFAAARNRCLEKVTGDWVLWLDAGERLDEESAVALRQFVDQQADPQHAYMLMVEMPSETPHGLAEQVAQLRLHARRDDLRFEGRIRETLQESIEALGMQVLVAEGRIIRHARDHHPGRKTLIAQRNLELAALETLEHGHTTPRLHLVNAQAYADLGATEMSRQEYRQAIASAEYASGEMLEGYYGLVASYDADEYFGDVQLRSCVEALESFPLDSQLLLATGNYLQQRGQTSLAVRSFQTAVQHGQVDLTVWHVVEIVELAAVSLALSMQLEQRGEESIRILRAALQRNPKSVRICRHLIDALVKQARCDEALKLVESLPLQPDLHEPMRLAIRGACEAMKEEWTAALGYLQSAYLAGCYDEPFCLRWLAVTLLSNAQVDAAKPVLKAWERLEPDNAELCAYLSAIERAEMEPAGLDSFHAETETIATGQHFRIDQGVTDLEILPPQFPTISQSFAINTSPIPAE